MIRQLHDLPDDERTLIQQKYGSYNDFPPNWRLVTQKEIVTKSMWRTYSPVLIEHRQMGQLRVGGPPLLGATLYYFHDGSGVGQVFDYEKGRIHYYRFHLCDHTYAEISRPAGNRSGLHRYRCTRQGCGYEYEVDTSD